MARAETGMHPAPATGLTSPARASDNDLDAPGSDVSSFFGNLTENSHWNWSAANTQYGARYLPGSQGHWSDSGYGTLGEFVPGFGIPSATGPTTPALVTPTLDDALDSERLTGLKTTDRLKRGDYGLDLSHLQRPGAERHRTSPGLNSPTFLIACFAAGTPILTPFGHQPIESLQMGDRVWSRPEDQPDAPPRIQVVEEVFRSTSALVRLHVSGRVIDTTELHPFFVVDHGWTAARDLQVGQVIRSHNGLAQTVQFLERSPQEVPVFNMRVSEDHTYFVGAADWGWSLWAHNECDAAEAGSPVTVAGSNAATPSTPWYQMGGWINPLNWVFGFQDDVEQKTTAVLQIPDIGRATAINRGRRARSLANQDVPPGMDSAANDAMQRADRDFLTQKRFIPDDVGNVMTFLAEADIDLFASGGEFVSLSRAAEKSARRAITEGAGAADNVKSTFEAIASKADRRSDVPVSPEMLATMRKEGARIAMGSEKVILLGKEMTADAALKKYFDGDNAVFIPHSGKDGVILLRSDATRLEALEEFFHRDQLLEARAKGEPFDISDPVSIWKYDLDAYRRIKDLMDVSEKGAFTLLEREILWEKMKLLNILIENYKGGKHK